MAKYLINGRIVEGSGKHLINGRIVELPSAAGGSSNTSNLPLGTLALTGLIPSFSTPDNNQSDLPLGTLALTGLVPQFTTGEANTASIPLGALALSGLAPNFTAGNSHVVDIPVGALALTGLAPTIESTELNTSNFPLGTLALSGQVPTFLSGASNQSSIPLGTLSLDGVVPQFITTDPVVGYKVAVLAVGTPLAYWKFDEISGTLAEDEMGNHDGTYVGSPTLTTATLLEGPDDIGDTCVTFADTKSISVPHSTDFDIGVSKSLVFSVKPSSLTLSHTIFHHGNIVISSEQGWVVAIRSDGRLGLTIHDGTGWHIVDTVSSYISAGVKAHVGIVIDVFGISFYVNGELKENISYVEGFATSTQSCTIGANQQISTEEHLVGDLDELIIYPNALSAANITTLFEAAIISDNDTAELPLGSLALTGLVPSFITQDPNTSNLSLGALDFTGLAPSFTSGASNLVSLPLGSLLLTGLAPQFITTGGPTIVTILINPLTLAESRYPLSSADGKDIPLDVLGPIKYLRQAITDVPLVFVVDMTGYEGVLIELTSPIDTLISFADTIGELTTDPVEYLLWAGERRVLLPTHQMFTMVAVNATEADNVDINILRKWNTLAIKDEM